MEIPTPQFPEDPRKVVRGIDASGNLQFEQVGIEELDYRGRFGATAMCNTENTIAIGEHKFVIQDDDNLFRIGDDVLITCLDDFMGHMWGEIIAKTSSPTELTVYVDDISSGILTSSNWELQVVARPKFGITKDVSTTSMDPTAAGPFTLTVTAGKFFPVGGKLLMIPLTARNIAFVGEVRAYSGTSLVVTKNATNATVSTSYTAWAIALLDAPQYATALYVMDGLKVLQNSANPSTAIDVLPGRVRDSTNTVDLALTSLLTKDLSATFAVGTGLGSYVQSANLTGTVSSAALAVTGSSTTFLSSFGSAPFLTDFSAQLALLPSLAISLVPTSIISSNGVTTSIVASSNTAATSGEALGAAASTYKRGGWFTGSAPVFYGVVLVRRDNDGLVDVATVAFNGSGTPDLPAGFTYYRVIAVWRGSDIYQPLLTLGMGEAQDITVNDAAFSTLSGSNLQEVLVDIDTHLIAYATGTFTPTVTLVGGAGNTVPVYSTNSGRYTKVGNQVLVDILLTGDGGAEGAGTGAVTIVLPITASASHLGGPFSVGAGQNSTSEYPLYGTISGAVSVITLSYFDTIANRTSFTGALQNNTTREIRLKFAYEV